MGLGSSACSGSNACPSCSACPGGNARPGGFQVTGSPTSYTRPLYRVGDVIRRPSTDEEVDIELSTPPRKLYTGPGVFDGGSNSFTRHAPLQERPARPMPRPVFEFVSPELGGYDGYVQPPVLEQ